MQHPSRKRSLTLQRLDERCGALGAERGGFLLDLGRIDDDRAGVGAARDERGQPPRVTGEQMQADDAAHRGSPHGRQGINVPG
ncbi:hypothetical protein [Streptomyces sp. NPDC051211]|uniref:hypothetical protein n=1 Tax=Streptomyces sp. NPDC051211 TaxID=3154643 RepID=UPI00344F245B